MCLRILTGLPDVTGNGVACLSREALAVQKFRFYLRYWHQAFRHTDGWLAPSTERPTTKMPDFEPRRQCVLKASKQILAVLDLLINKVMRLHYIHVISS